MDHRGTEHLGILRSAVREHHKLSLRYRSGGARESTTRTISPHSLAHAEHMWYVVATSDDDTVRFFRLDRVESVEFLNDTFQPDAGVVAGVMESGRAFDSPSRTRMTVRYSPRISAWVAERAGEKVAADGSLTLEHQVADESWAVRHVLQYGPEAELLAPPELRQRVVEALAPLLD